MPNTAVPPEVARFFPAHVALPMFPEVASRLLRTFGDDNVGLDQMADLIGQDPALTAKVLRLANSARYSPGRDIVRLRDAAAALGVNTLRNLALSACLADAFPATQGLDTRAFWRHGMACATFAQLLARASDLDSETAYVAGLMLRVGELVMLGIDAAGVADIEAKAHEPGSRFDWEHQRWHCAHTDVTAELSRRWKFPDALTTAFAACADPLQVRPFSALGAMLHCAEVMADASIEAVDPIEALQESVSELVAHLHLDLPWLRERLQALPDPGDEAQVLVAA
jgi:HD-like signal output (HDOD) protein